MPNPSSRTDSQSALLNPASFLRERSQATANTIAPTSAAPPDHLVASAAPKARPVTTRHGRKMGEGGRSGGRGSSRDSSAKSSVAGGGGAGLSLHRPPSTRKRQPAPTNVATKKPSIANRRG